MSIGGRNAMSAQQPALTVVPGGLTPAALRTARDQLWEAWRRLPDFEDRAGDLGAGLAADLITLWAVWRFGGTDPGEPLLRELVDDEYRLRFHDPLVEDMILVAFA